MVPIDYLATIPLFNGLSRENLEYLQKIAHNKGFKRGQVIFSEGDEGNGFYVVISGRIKIFKLSREGKEQILHFFYPGDPFGEVPVFAGECFPASAEALEETQTLFFPRNAIIELIKGNPSFAMNMLAVLSRRLHTFTLLIEDLSLKEVPCRLAAYLLYHYKEKDELAGFTLDISKTQLSSLLGTIPETLSRILTRMAKEGLIQSDGPRRIKILDRKGLRELADGLRRLT